MKLSKALLIGTAFAALAATSAKAADLTPIMPAEPPMTAPMAPTFSWAGPYAGLSGFVGWCGGPVICIPSIVYGGALTVGYNAAFGNFVVGAEGQVSAFGAIGPVVLAEANARAGYAVADRVLLYTQAGIGARVNLGGAFYYTLGAGIEVAATDAVSLFTEVAPYHYFGGGPVFWRASVGVNFHFGH